MKGRGPSLNGSNGHSNGGRPSIRSDALAQQIFERIAQGDSLNRICKDGLIAWPTVCRWIKEDETFRKNYVLAKELCAEKYADEIVDIADDGKNDTYVDEDGKQFTNNDVIQRSRLRVDARKWVVSKLLPKKYGEKGNDVTVNNSVHNYVVAPEKLKEIRQRHARALEGYAR